MILETPFLDSGGQPYPKPDSIYYRGAVKGVNPNYLGVSVGDGITEPHRRASGPATGVSGVAVGSRNCRLTSILALYRAP
jgi:hypothetical protein